MAEKTIAYIGLGSNLGDRRDNIDKAVKLLSENTQINVIRVSDIIETAALTGDKQPDYLNGVIEIETTLSAELLHKTTMEIETSLGRVKGEKWSSRPIDLDLLLFGSKIIDTPNLTIPHSQLHLRSFVLNGLCQLNGAMLHPVLNASMQELTSRLRGRDFVLDNDQPQLISIAGLIGVGKTTLTKNLTSELDAKELLEPYDENPFMPDVYAGKNELALDSELYFLTSRAEQLAPENLKSGEIFISDYIFDKALLYARKWLDPPQLGLYERVYPSIAEKVTKPAILIYMHGPTEVCLERIHTRNRPYEQKIEPQFLDALEKAYEQLLEGWQSCPVIRLSILDFDCTNDKDLANMANQLRGYITV